MKHTAGKWEVNLIKNGACHIDPRDGHGRIATVWIRYNKINNLEEVEANARLIASSPILLEELKKAVDKLCNCCKSINPNYRDCETCKDVDSFKQAIAAAEGRDEG